MFVVAHHFSQAGGLAVIVFVVVAIFVALHALHCLLFQQRDAVHHPQALAPQVHRLQDRLHPGVRLPAQVEEQIAVLHCQDVRRRWLIGVALGSRRQQQLHLRQVSARRPGKIISRKHGGHHRQLVRITVLRRALPAGRERQQHCHGRTEKGNVLHRYAPLN